MMHSLELLFYFSAKGLGTQRKLFDIAERVSRVHVEREHDDFSNFIIILQYKSHLK